MKSSPGPDELVALTIEAAYGQPKRNVLARKIKPLGGGTWYEAVADVEEQQGHIEDTSPPSTPLPRGFAGD